MTTSTRSLYGPPAAASTHNHGRRAPKYYRIATLSVTVGEVFLEAITTGVITDREMAWVASNQGRFSRAEEAAALRLGRLVDEGLNRPMP